VSDAVDSGEDQREQDRARAKKALDDLDRQLEKLKRERRPGRIGGVVMIAAVFLVLAPILWVLAYRFIEAPATLLMAQRAFEGQHVTHAPVKLNAISPHLIRAVLAAEDARFCRHNGFDMQAIQAAYASNQSAANMKRGKVRGGSTISQQMAKNLFLWPQRSLLRKGVEAYFTTLAERAWPKRRILEAYLNAAEWGDGLFGAEAAARARFGVSAARLTPHQAALLAAVLPSPNRWSAVRPGPYVRRRAATIEARMWALHAQGLDDCVLDASAPPPPAPKTRLPKNQLPQLPALPADVAAATDAPTITTEEEAPAADSVLAAPSFEDGQVESVAPADASAAPPPIVTAPSETPPP
jgi:monofunctional biosynthetic peptidoglycan transglycosylase